MNADDCVKLMLAISGTQLAMVAALTKLYITVRGNRRMLQAQRLSSRVKPQKP